MSFRINDISNEQIVFNDRLLSLSERERKYLESSWAVQFAEIIFPAIDETPFEVLFSETYSRPNTPVNIIIGGLILKEFLNLTDDEFVQSVMFDIRFQYALHTLSYKEQPFSDRTFSRFRRRSIINTNLTGRKPQTIDAEFTITDNSVICPNGNRPESISVSNEIYHLKFRCSVCENCPKRNECNPHFVPGYAIRNISETRIQRAEQMKFRETDELKKYSAIRNGVESIPSVMRRKYKADKMPVRGLIKTKLWFGFKIVAFNFTKLCLYEQGLRKASKNEIKAII